MARGTINVKDWAAVVCPLSCAFRIAEWLQEAPDGKTP
jgi:hypothetical protein